MNNNYLIYAKLRKSQQSDSSKLISCLQDLRAFLELIQRVKAILKGMDLGKGKGRSLGWEFKWSGANLFYSIQYLMVERVAGWGLQHLTTVSQDSAKKIAMQGLLFSLSLNLYYFCNHWNSLKLHEGILSWLMQVLEFERLELEHFWEIHRRQLVNSDDEYPAVTQSGSGAWMDMRCFKWSNHGMNMDQWMNVFEWIRMDGSTAGFHRFHKFHVWEQLGYWSAISTKFLLRVDCCDFGMFGQDSHAERTAALAQRSFAGPESSLAGGTPRIATLPEGWTGDDHGWVGFGNIHPKMNATGGSNVQNMFRI